MTTKAKICGIRSEEVLDVALAAGADYAGFVLYARSPRNVDIATAHRLIARTKDAGRTKAVLLVVDPTDDLLDEVARGPAPDILQLHGHESRARVGEVRETWGIPIWKACPVATTADVEAAWDYHAPGRLADLILFDAKPPADPEALPGGNGLSFDWRILTGAKGGYPFALAGGLTPENVAAAIRLTGASIVDVSSGVESAPGIKDPGLIRRFLNAVKTANQTP